MGQKRHKQFCQKNKFAMILLVKGIEPVEHKANFRLIVDFSEIIRVGVWMNLLAQNAFRQNDENSVIQNFHF